MSVIFTILILGMIIFIHELGHFITAKHYKMPVSEFAIGMGPKLISRKIGETVYSIRALPLGGFVNIGGMQYEEVPGESENIETEYGESGYEKKKHEETEHREEKREIIQNRSEKWTKEEIENIIKNNREGFFTKPPLARFIVLAAGVFMNFITALVGIFLLLSITGVKPLTYTDPVIEEVASYSRARNILKPGDRIVEFNREKIENWSEFIREISLINGKNTEKSEGIKKNIENEEFSIKVLRDGEELENKVMLTYSSETESYVMGIQVKPQNMNFLEKITISGNIFFNYFKLTFNGIKMLITGRVSVNEMTGPVGLPKLVGKAYEEAGYTALLNIFILLSVNIGLMNLLPIPALDGGRIVFIIPEFFGFKVSKRIEEKIHLIGIIILFALMILVMFNDIKKYIPK